MNALADPKPASTRYRIEEMDCPTEESMIRSKLKDMHGVTSLEFNLVQRVLTVKHTLKETAVLETAIRSLGFEPVLHDPEVRSGPVPDSSHGTSGHDSGRSRSPFLRSWLVLVLAGLAALGAEIAELAGWASPWLPAGLALVAVVLGGAKTWKKGWTALANRNLNINALMSIAVTGALVLQQWPEAAMVMVLFALAEKIEALSLDRARKSLKSLMALSPEQATVQMPGGSWEVVEATGVKEGSLVRIRPGERFSHDGVILEGSSAVDQSPVTGESLPVDKVPLDSVFAGTINQEGELVVRVTAEAKNSTLSRIIHLVEEAQGNKSSTQRFVDQFARIYTPVVVGLGVLIALLPPLFAGGAWTDWIYKALVLLVIACPCALVISTPVTIVSALTRAARGGMIIKGGVYLELARKITWLAFDKTGTLTRGKPVLTDCLLPGEPGALQDQEGTVKTGMLNIAASLAIRSDHPVSRALAFRAEEEGLKPLEVSGFRALPGRGVQGLIDGQLWHLGNHRLMEELGSSTPELEASLGLLEAGGKTTVVLACSGKVRAIFGVSDCLRDSSRAAVENLQRLGIKTLMLSGDRQQTVGVMAAQAGIDVAHGNLLPGDKARIIAELAGSGQVVAMVGDGINDAPALARAHIGLAMGGTGSDIALETADVVIMDEDLGKIGQLVSLSRTTVAVLGQNIVLALGIKAVFLVLTLLGHGTLWMAVFADMGASLLVVFNGLRLTGKSRIPGKHLTKSQGKVVL